MLIGRMHNSNITAQQIADELGVRKSYISMILNGTRSPKNGRERLEKAFENIVERRKNEH